MASTAVPISGSETKITVPGIIVEDGKCDIGLYVNGSNTLTLGRMSFTPCEETRTPLLKGGEYLSSPMLRTEAESSSTRTETRATHCRLWRRTALILQEFVY